MPVSPRPVQRSTRRPAIASIGLGTRGLRTPSPASSIDSVRSLGIGVWRTLTSVRFAVLQIITLAVAGLIGTLLSQIGSFALRDPAGYAAEMAAIHARYDPNVGPGAVDLLERLGFLRVFAAPWFIGLLVLLVISIVVGTLDRTPRLWRGVSRVIVRQPDAFFDLRLSERASFRPGSLSADDVMAALRMRRFKVRRISADDGSVEWLNGDRFQYFRMATLLTHLGLILFLLGGAVTAALGFETVVFVGEGQTAPVQPVGTPHNLLVKNISFQAPQRPDGSFVDFRTDLGVYRDGRQVARKTITVNDPLEVDGSSFTKTPSVPAQTWRSGTRMTDWCGPVPCCSRGSWRAARRGS